MKNSYTKSFPSGNWFRILSIVIFTAAVLVSGFFIPRESALAATLEVGVGKTYSAIQPAIDAAIGGDVINVFPGTYNQDEANGFDPVTGASGGSSNFNIFVNKSVTIQGVDASGIPITNYNDVAAFVVAKRNTPLGNLSTFFVQADNVTITGLDITAYNIDPDYNFKTISVIGNNTTIKYCKLHNLDQVSNIYIYDPNYNSGTETSYVQSYRFEGNYFDAGGTYASGIRISSGPGWTGDVGNRVITGNSFKSGGYGIEFVGPGGDSWDLYPVGAASITANTFSGQDKGSVVAWGKYNEADGYGNIDWNNVFSSNIFDKAVLVKTPENSVRYYDSLGGVNFYFVRGIYSAIQRYPISKVVQAGDTINVAAGTYAEENIAINKSLTLQGAGPSLTTIDASASASVGKYVFNIDIASGNVKIDGFKIKNGKELNGIYAKSTSADSVITVSNNEIQGFGTSDNWDYGLIAGYGSLAKVIVEHNIFNNTYSNSILFERQIGETLVDGNSLSGIFPSIWYMNYGGVDITTLQKVSNNTIDMALSDPTFPPTAIGFASGYNTMVRTGKYAKIEVNNNTITNLQSFSAGDSKAISLANENNTNGTDAEIISPKINNNVISGTGGIGINLVGYVTGADISGNTITGGKEGLKIGKGSYSGDFYPIGTIINKNGLSGASSKILIWSGSEELDARNNWWGSSVLATVQSQSTGTVNFLPYYIAAEMTTLSDVKTITNFSFSSGPGAINETNHSVSVNVPNGTNVAALIPTITFSGASVSPSSGVVQDFSGPVIYTVKSVDESTTQDYEVTVTELPSNQIPAAPTVSVDTTQKEVVVNSSEGTVITIPSTVKDATINVDSLTTDNGTSTTATLPSITLNVTTELSATAVNVEIPDSTVVTAPTGWNGVINAPQVKANSTVTATPDSGKTATVSSVIEVGYGDVKLIFDKAVRILIPEQAGKYVGYSRSGVFTPITSVCPADTQTEGNNLAPEGDCKIDVGSDLVIWTKHFTAFATYTQTTNPVSVGGSGGGSDPFPPGASISSPGIAAQKVDINKDGKIDVLDFNTLMVNWGKTESGNIADFNNDGKVDIFDFNLLMVNWTK